MICLVVYKLWVISYDLFYKPKTNKVNYWFTNICLYNCKQLVVNCQCYISVVDDKDALKIKMKNAYNNSVF